MAGTVLYNNQQEIKQNQEIIKYRCFEILKKLNGKE